jgi:hypothetical protein
MRKGKTPDQGSSLGRLLLLYVVPVLIFGLGFIPFVLAGYIFVLLFRGFLLWFLILLPFFLYISIILTIYSQVFISGCCIKGLHLTYKPGVFSYCLRDTTSFKWILVCSLYTPIRKILETVPIGKPKNTYFRLLGMKLGTNSLVGGVIKDPCVTEIGDNTTIGEYSVIYGHIHNYDDGTITISKVTIGSNCVIGAGAIIMPGAEIQDNVIVAAGAVVTKQQVLKRGKRYGGVPAKEIKYQKD